MKGRKKIILVVFAVAVVAITSVLSVWAITTPKWSFSVTTDKSTYELGESVQITATLKNLGFIEHSFKSAVDVPFVVSVEMDGSRWLSPYHPDATEFTVPPHQSLERTFNWNQTWTRKPWWQNQTYVPGTYTIVAFTPKVEEGWTSITSHPRFFTAYTSINITEGW